MGEIAVPSAATHCIVVAELGPNPAPLTEALWSLARLQGMAVDSAFVLTNRRGARYLEDEVLSPETALDQLRSQLGDLVPPRDAVRVTIVLNENYEPVDDDEGDADAGRWNDVRWQHALDALAFAGDRPAVFLLAGGRRRTTTALQVVAFQMLARPQDRLVDVRVSDSRVEGARAGFYFPEQPRKSLVTSAGVVVAREIQVHLIQVVVPRLRRVIRDVNLRNYAAALSVGQRALDAIPSVELLVDLPALDVTIDGVRVELTDTLIVWYATLAVARVNEGDDGWVSTGALGLARGVLSAIKKHRADWQPPSEVWKLVMLEDTKKAMTKWPKLISIIRSKTKLALEDHVHRHGLSTEVARLVVPEMMKTTGGGGKKETRWRVALDPSRITLIGL